MPSTYSTNLRFELIGTGEQAGTWGTTTNTNIGTLIEQAIAGATTVSMSDANHTLTTNNGASDQARNVYINLTSGVSLTVTRTVTCPAVSKVYVVRNATTGGQSILFTAGGTGVTIPNGRTVVLVCDGTDVRLAHDYLGTVVADAGVVATPGYTFVGQTSDGIYSPAANTVAVATNGVERLRATNLGVTLPGGYLTAQPSFRNRIINGDFLIWQRGSSQTSSGYGSDDRWFNANTGSTKTHSFQAFTLGQTDVPGEPTAFSRTVVTSVAGASNFVIKQQRIEGVRIAAGQTVTLSFWAKADTNRPIAIDLAQLFGTGGSPSSAVIGIGAQKFTLSASWQRFTATIAVPSISGKTLGSNGDDSLELTFWFDAGSTFNSRTATLGQQSGTFDIARVQLEVGGVATPFEVRHGAVELSLCQRYFHTTVGSTYGATVFRSATSGNFGGVQPFMLRHPVPMSSAATPSVVVYPASTRANAGNVLVNNTTQSTSFVAQVDRQSVFIYNNAALTSVGDYFVGFVDVSAEL